MTAVVPFASAGLVPSNMAEAMRLAEMMATAKLVPVALQKSPADCLMVIQQAIRWEMDPFAVAQECSVIQGKLMHSGKLVAAVVNARGNLVDRLSFSYEGEGENRTITVVGRLQGESSPREVKVKLSDAKTNNRVWQTQPDQQLMYHGARVWARRHTPELMLGVHSPEEFDAKSPPHNPDTGEIIESDGAELAAPSDAADAAPSSELSPREVGAALLIEQLAKEAAMRGEKVFREFYRHRSEPEKKQINAMGDELREILDRASPAGGDRHPVADVDDAGEGGGEQDGFTAVPDPLVADDIGDHLAIVRAYKAGTAAKAAGHARKALPGPLRDPSRSREQAAWIAGWQGEPCPELGYENP